MRRCPKLTTTCCPSQQGGNKKRNKKTKDMKAAVPHCDSQSVIFRKKIRVLLGMALIWCAVALVGCTAVNAGGDAGESRPVRVLCTTGMIAEAVREIGGLHVNVDQLIPPGMDPHLYRPTARDKWRIHAADVVFYNGLRLEGRLESLLARRARFMPVFAVTEKLQQNNPEKLRRLDEGSTVFDPHVWLDPLLWAECVRYTAECLSKVDPSRSEQFARRAETYVSEIILLDEYARHQLETIPPDRRFLITTHDAFGYFGNRYQLQVSSLQGLSTLEEIDLGTMNELIDQLVREKIPAVFVENSVSPSVLEAVVAGCQARGHNLRIGGELYADCLGPPGSPGETYLGAFRWNVDVIVRALR